MSSTALRRHRFESWFTAKYGPPDSADARKRFMADSGNTGEAPLTKGRVSQLFDVRQPFGEKAARQLALRFGLAEEYFLHVMPELEEAANPERAMAEMRVLLDLRDLMRINPETHERVVGYIQKMADGARASDAMLGLKSKKGYVTPQRARETLGKNQPPPVAPDQANARHDELLGGVSGFDQFDSVSPAPPKPRKK